MSTKKASKSTAHGTSGPKQDPEVVDLLNAAAEAIRSGDYWKAKSDLSSAVSIVDQQILDMEHAGQK